MAWPNNSTWSAERDKQIVFTDEGNRFTWVVDCGLLTLPSGKLVACDPFAFMRKGDNPHVIVPPGRYPALVTLADVSENLDRSEIREAYVTLRIAEGIEATRRALPLALEGEARLSLTEDEYIGFGVDAGTACFVDDEALADCMPDESTWLEELFDNDEDNCWFAQMDNPNHIREGIANIELPFARNGENILIVHSGWGDGVYPVVGSFDSVDQLIAVHIDFFVIP